MGWPPKSFIGFSARLALEIVAGGRTWWFQVRIFMVNGIEKLCPKLGENLRDRLPVLLKLCIRAMMLD